MQNARTHGGLETGIGLVRETYKRDCPAELEVGLEYLLTIKYAATIWAILNQSRISSGYLITTCERIL